MEVETQMKRKIQERNTYVTLEQSFNEFIQQKEANGLSPATLRNYKLSYHIFFDYNEFDSETPITEIKHRLTRAHSPLSCAMDK